jgi:peptide/nickel transport system permease protein
MGELNPPLLEPRDHLARRLLRDPLALTGSCIMVLFALLAVAAPYIASHDPTAVDPVHRLLGPSAGAPLGTDALGRDLFSRIVFGARWSLGAAFVTTGFVFAVGVIVGLAAGYLGGVVDAVLMRIVDALLSFPSLLLALAIVGILGPGVSNAVLALTAAGWATYARIVRGLVLTIRERPFIDAARAVGGTDGHIMLRHVLPNVLAPVAVLATLELGEVLLALSALSFLGLGAQPPAPEWGAMLNDARSYFFIAPRLMLVPGAAITLAVVGLNLLGDGLRDVLDPRLR